MTSVSMTLKSGGSVSGTLIYSVFTIHSVHRTVLVFLVNLGCLLCTAIFPGLPAGCVWSRRFGHRSERTATRVKVKRTSGSQCFKPSPTCRDLVPKSRRNQVLVSLRLVLGLNKSKSIAKTTSKTRPKRRGFLL